MNRSAGAYVQGVIRMFFKVVATAVGLVALTMATQASAEWKVQTGTSEKSGKRYGIVYYEKDIPGPDDSTSEVIIDCFKDNIMAVRFAWHIHGETNPDLFSGRFVYQFHKEDSVDINLKVRFNKDAAYYTADFPYAGDAADDFIEGMVYRDFVGVIGYYKDGTNTGVTTYDQENFEDAFFEACGWHKDYELFMFWF